MGAISRIGKAIRDTVWGRRLLYYRRLSIRARLLNWFVHRVVYRVRGLDFSVHFTSRVSHPANITLGRHVWYQVAVSGGCYIQAANGVVIGDDTLIAPGVKIISSNHSLADHSKSEPNKPIRIGRGCWLGANSVILPGVQLGDEVVVAAGAVVTKSFQARSIIAGVPARRIGQLEGTAPVKPLWAEDDPWAAANC